MKYINIILLIISVGSLTAQSNAIDYQAVLTDIDGEVLKNVSAEVKVDIIQGSAAVYTEVHDITTGSAGQITLGIGEGNATFMTMNDIDWSENSYIDLAVKPEGLTTYLSQGQRDILSVPYALFALNLRCDQGCPGEKGSDGLVGPQGPQGPRGNTGITGTQGDDGAPGDQGAFGMETLDVTSTPPSSPSEGQLYMDDGSNRTDNQIGLRYYDGTSWSDL